MLRTRTLLSIVLGALLVPAIAARAEDKPAAAADASTEQGEVPKKVYSPDATALIGVITDLVQGKNDTAKHDKIVADVEKKGESLDADAKGILQAVKTLREQVAKNGGRFPGAGK